MGGKALHSLGIESRRVSTQELYQIYNEISQIVNEKMGIETFMGSFYAQKPDHGDVDVLLKIDKENININQWIKDNISTKGIHNNGGVNSFEYKDFQVDFIPINSDNWELAKVWFSYDPIHNLLGKISHRFGAKYGWDGLRLMYQTKMGHEWDNIVLSKDPREIFNFMGYDYDKYSQGFDTLQEILDYIISGKYFSIELFLMENLRHIDRKRNKNRGSYQKFLAYCEENKDKLPNYPFEKDKSKYLPYLNECFPNARIFERIVEIETKEKELEEIRLKFNGHLLMGWYPELNGKYLGFVIERYKKSKDNFENFIKENSKESIERDFKNWFPELSIGY